MVVGVWDLVTDPEETIEGVTHSVLHPEQTSKYIIKSIKDSYERDMVNGDAYSRAHWVTYGFGTVLGGKGAGAVTKTGVATTKAVVVKGANRAKELTVSLPGLLPYNPRNQLVLAGGVPYNTVNSNGLKEQLISMARLESEINGKGGPKKEKPKQIHHYATNKSKTYTYQLESVTNKYDLDLDDTWNKELLPHQGRHPNAYHEYVLDRINEYDAIARGNKEIFLELFEGLKKEVRDEPSMLYKDYWLKKK